MTAQKRKKKRENESQRLAPTAILWAAKTRASYMARTRHVSTVPDTQNLLGVEHTRLRSLVA